MKELETHAHMKPESNQFSSFPVVQITRQLFILFFYSHLVWAEISQVVVRSQTHAAHILLHQSNLNMSTNISIFHIFMKHSFSIDATTYLPTYSNDFSMSRLKCNRLLKMESPIGAVILFQ